MPIYRTSGPIGVRSLVDDYGGKLPEKKEIINTAMQLNMIPENSVMFCKRLSMSMTHACAFLTIANVNTSFNNSAGLLSTMTQQQVYIASVARGLNI